MTRDPTRLLLGLAEELDRAALRKRIGEFRLVLEDEVDAPLRRFRDREAAPAAPPAGRAGTVNHTPRRYWVRSVDGEALVPEALLEGLGDLLEWVGPVYRLGNTQGQGGLLCPLPHTLLVRPRSDLQTQEKSALTRTAERLGLREDKRMSPLLAPYRYFVLKDPRAGTSYDVRRRLEREEGEHIQDVSYEHMPLLLPLLGEPNDTLYPQQWSMAQIQAGGAGTTAWDLSTGVPGVVVAVLDTGCDLTHPDLSYVAGTSLGPGGGNGQPGAFGGSTGHGTCCAGIVAATHGNGQGVAGVAGGCRIMPIAASSFSDAEVAAGLNFARTNGANVVSMSFGVYGAGEGMGPTGWNFAVIDPAIAAAHADGLVLCAATGNENFSGNNRYPARHPLVMACGASDQADERKNPSSPDGENWWGSNWGLDTHLGQTTGVSVVAPGVLLPTTDIQGAAGYGGGDYINNFNGTSGATPHVAGLAALLLSLYPGLTNQQVRAVIERTAEKTGATPYADDPDFPNGTWNQAMGHGRINALRALDLADAHIRDWSGDGGAEPSTPPAGNFWSFSDIVLRPADDDVFVPSDPDQSKKVERGQVNHLYVRVTNNGPGEARNVTVNARITPWVGIQFAYPDDWTSVDAMHVAPTPVVSSFASIPAGGSAIAKFTVSAAQAEELWGWEHGSTWHPCLLAEVDADNDHAFHTADLSGGGLIVRRNNLAQRNLTTVDVLLGAPTTAPFVAGNRRDGSRTMVVVVDRSRLPGRAQVLLDPAADPSLFPAVDFTPPREADGAGEGIVFLERTRVRTRLGGCEGILVLERGSRIECRDRHGPRLRSVHGGESVVRDGHALVDVRDRQATVELEKDPGSIHAMALRVRVPEDTPPGDYLLSVSQRDGAGRTVGGASYLLRVR